MAEKMKLSNEFGEWMKEFGHNFLKQNSDFLSREKNIIPGLIADNYLKQTNYEGSPQVFGNETFQLIFQSFYQTKKIYDKIWTKEFDDELEFWEDKLNNFFIIDENSLNEITELKNIIKSLKQLDIYNDVDINETNVIKLQYIKDKIEKGKELNEILNKIINNIEKFEYSFIKYEIENISSKIIYQLINKLKELDNGESIYLYGGYSPNVASRHPKNSGHSMIYEFKNISPNQFNFYCYNTGDGLREDIFIEKDQKWIPRLLVSNLSLKQISKSNFMKFHICEIYLGIHYIFNENITFEKEFSSDFWKLFGVSNQIKSDRKIMSKDSERYYQFPQWSGTCSFACFYSLFNINIENRFNWDFFRYGVIPFLCFEYLKDHPDAYYREFYYVLYDAVIFELSRWTKDNCFETNEICYLWANFFRESITNSMSKISNYFIEKTRSKFNKNAINGIELKDSEILDKNFAIFKYSDISLIKTKFNLNNIDPELIKYGINKKNELTDMLSNNFDLKMESILSFVIDKIIPMEYQLTEKNIDIAKINIELINLLIEKIDLDLFNNIKYPKNEKDIYILKNNLINQLENISNTFYKCITIIFKNFEERNNLSSDYNLILCWFLIASQIIDERFEFLSVKDLKELFENNLTCSFFNMSFPRILIKMTEILDKNSKNKTNNIKDCLVFGRISEKIYKLGEEISSINLSFNEDVSLYIYNEIKENGGENYIKQLNYISNIISKKFIKDNSSIFYKLLFYDSFIIINNKADEEFLDKNNIDFEYDKELIYKSEDFYINNPQFKRIKTLRINSRNSKKDYNFFLMRNMKMYLKSLNDYYYINFSETDPKLDCVITFNNYLELNFNDFYSFVSEGGERNPIISVFGYSSTNIKELIESKDNFSKIRYVEILPMEFDYEFYNEYAEKFLNEDYEYELILSEKYEDYEFNVRYTDVIYSCLKMKTIIPFLTFIQLNECDNNWSHKIANSLLCFIRSSDWLERDYINNSKNIINIIKKVIDKLKILITKEVYKNSKQVYEIKSFLWLYCYLSSFIQKKEKNNLYFIESIYQINKILEINENLSEKINFFWILIQIIYISSLNYWNNEISQYYINLSNDLKLEQGSRTKIGKSYQKYIELIHFHSLSNIDFVITKPNQKVSKEKFLVSRNYEDFFYSNFYQANINWNLIENTEAFIINERIINKIKYLFVEDKIQKTLKLIIQFPFSSEQYYYVEIKFDFISNSFNIFIKLNDENKEIKEGILLEPKTMKIMYKIIFSDNFKSFKLYDLDGNEVIKLSDNNEIYPTLINFGNRNILISLKNNKIKRIQYITLENLYFELDENINEYICSLEKNQYKLIITPSKFVDILRSYSDNSLFLERIDQNNNSIPKYKILISDNTYQNEKNRFKIDFIGNNLYHELNNDGNNNDLYGISKLDKFFLIDLYFKTFQYAEFYKSFIKISDQYIYDPDYYEELFRIFENNYSIPLTPEEYKIFADIYNFSLNVLYTKSFDSNYRLYELIKTFIKNVEESLLEKLPSIGDLIGSKFETNSIFEKENNILINYNINNDFSLNETFKDLKEEFCELSLKINQENIIDDKIQENLKRYPNIFSKLKKLIIGKTNFIPFISKSNIKLFKYLNGFIEIMNEKIKSFEVNVSKLYDNFYKIWYSNSKQLLFEENSLKENLVDKLIKLIFTNDYKIWKNYNPYITDENIKSILEYFIAYLQSSADLKYLKKLFSISKQIQELFNKKDNFDKLKEEDLSLLLDQLCSQYRNFNPYKEPIIMAFEYKFSRKNENFYYLKPQQIEPLRLLEKNEDKMEIEINEDLTNGTITQLVVGIGKTSVIIPNVIYNILKSTDKLVIVVLPENLFNSRIEISESLYSIYQIRSRNFPTYNPLFEIQGSSSIIAILEKCSNNKTVVFATPEMLYRVNTSIWKLLETDYKTMASDYYYFLSEQTEYVVDEVDLIYDPNKVFQQSIGILSSTNIQKILMILDIYQIYFGLNENDFNFILPLKTFNLNNKITMTKEIYDKILKPILKQKFLLKNENYNNINELNSFLDAIFLYILNKEFRKEYGVPYLEELNKSIIKNNLNEGFAIPCKGANAFAFGSEFGTSDEMLCLTLQSIVIEGIINTQLKKFFQIIRNKSISNIKKLLENSSKTFSVETVLMEINLYKIFKLMNINQYYLKYLLIEIDEIPYDLILKEINEKNLLAKDRPYFYDLIQEFFISYRYSSESILASPVELTFGAKTYGFTGTNWNPNMYPIGIEAKIDEESSRLLIQKLMFMENGNSAFIRSISLSLKSNNNQLQELISRFYPDDFVASYSTIIDAGGYFYLFDSNKVAEEMLNYWKDKDKNLYGVVYFEKDGKPYCLKINNELEPYDRKIVPKNQYIIAFYDQPRTIGSDLEFPSKAKAQVTIGKGLLLKDLIQAVGRMRKLDPDRQKVLFVIENDIVKNWINSKLNLKKEIDFIDLLAFLSLNQENQIKKDNQKILLQKLDFLKIQLFYKIFGNYITKKIETNNIINIFYDTKISKILDNSSNNEEIDSNLWLNNLNIEWKNYIESTILKINDKSLLEYFNNIFYIGKNLINNKNYELENKVTVNSNLGKQLEISIEKETQTEISLEVDRTLIPLVNFDNAGKKRFFPLIDTINLLDANNYLLNINYFGFMQENPFKNLLNLSLFKNIYITKYSLSIDILSKNYDIVKFDISSIQFNILPYYFSYCLFNYEKDKIILLNDYEFALFYKTLLNQTISNINSKNTNYSIYDLNGTYIIGSNENDKLTQQSKFILSFIKFFDGRYVFKDDEKDLWNSFFEEYLTNVKETIESFWNFYSKYIIRNWIRTYSGESNLQKWINEFNESELETKSKKRTSEEKKRITRKIKK
jgi:hypothetical protein